MPKRRLPARKSNSTASPGRTSEVKAKSVQQKGSTEPRGLAELLKALEESDETVKGLVDSEYDLILECRVCKSLFRNIKNLSNHKRNYCTSKHSVVGSKSPSKMPATRSKSGRIVGGKKPVSDDLTRELEEAMLDMGEGSEEDQLSAKKRKSDGDEDYDPLEEEEVEGETDGGLRGRPATSAKQTPKTRPWSTPQAPAERPLKKFMDATASEPRAKRQKLPSLGKIEATSNEGNKCRHCQKVFMNKAGVVSHERYCAALTMKPLLGRGLAFSDDFTSDIPTPTSSAGAVYKSPGSPAQPLKQIVSLPKGAVIRRSDGDGQTYIVTTINGQQRAIPVRPATGPPPVGGTPGGGRAFVKVAVPAGSKPGQVVLVPASPTASPAKVASPPATPGTPTPVSSPKPANAADQAKPAGAETPKTPSQSTPQGPQAPIPSSLQPDLVKLLKEFSNISGTKFFTMPELVSLNGDPLCGTRLKELIMSLPPAGLIASKPISSGVLTKIILSRPDEGEPGSLKVVVVESGYSSQMRLKQPARNGESFSSPVSTPMADDVMDEPMHEDEEVLEEEPEDVKNVVDKLFDENQGGGDEEEELDDEERMKRAKALLPPPKPVLRKMNLKMDSLLQSAVSRQVKKKQQKEDEAFDDDDDDEEDAAETESTVKEKLRKDNSDVTFKEMFAMPEPGDEDVSATPEEYLAKAAIMLTTPASTSGDSQGSSSDSEKNLRRSAFSRSK